MTETSEVRVVFRPAGRAVRVPKGTLVTAAAGQVGVSIDQICGGKGTCGKCKVKALAGGLSPMGDTERKHLTPQEIADGFRLACQAAILEDTSIEIGWSAATAGISILVEGMLAPVAREPLVQKQTVQVPPSTIHDQTADYEALLKALDSPLPLSAPVALSSLRALPGALRAQEGLVTAVRSGDLLVAVEPGDTTKSIYGLAVDIGTTTVVGYLLDLHTGQRVAVASTLNPQTRFGDDVITRIDVAARDAAGLEALHGVIVNALDNLIEQTVQQVGATREQVYAVTVVGNTTMHHLFLGLNPYALGRAPYIPAMISPLQLNAAEAGLHANPAAQLFVLPNIAGYLGADTVGVLLATRLHLGDDVRLAIDIGTNGEMALGSKERLLACSTAAGPAFEGAQLTFGMRAVDGAIDKVDLDTDVRLHSIGKGKLRGICGSGAVDVIAGLRRLGLVDETGRLLSPDEAASVSKELAGRIVPQAKGWAFVLAEAEAAANGAPILFTQRDIRQIQLAKGAIRAGIEILMKELGAAPEQVVEICLAGAFGNYIRPASALTIGLMPRFPHAAITPVGNAAGAGAQLALLSRPVWREAADLVRHVEHVELSQRQDFQSVFMDAMMM